MKKIINPNTVAIYILISILQSCQNLPYNYAEKWSIEIKQKIIADANEVPNRTIYDSSNNNVVIYKEDKKLKLFHIVSEYNDDPKSIFLDTTLSIFYSTDQNFELIKEPCTFSNRSFEGLKYKGLSVGLAEFKYCDGKIKERGFRFNNIAVGIWTKYDSTGKVIEEIDKGNLNLLKKLKDIKYNH